MKEVAEIHRMSKDIGFLNEVLTKLRSDVCTEQQHAITMLEDWYEELIQKRKCFWGIVKS
jgi:hypothetical protein